MPLDNTINYTNKRDVRYVQGFGLSFIPDLWLNMGKGVLRIFKGRFKSMGYRTGEVDPCCNTVMLFLGCIKSPGKWELGRKREISGGGPKVQKWRRRNGKVAQGLKEKSRLGFLLPGVSF